VTPVEILVYFNFRSPYCYLASKRMFEIFDEFHAKMLFKPLGGWSGRSAPERAVKKIVSTRQDVARFARKWGIPFMPPPVSTDPTRAGRLSLLMEQKGLLRPYIVEVMRAEWAHGLDIGLADVLLPIAEALGVSRSEAEKAAEDEGFNAILEANWQEADAKNIFGVPTFMIGDEIFWGQDRIDFVKDHLRDLRLAKL
jgi:2-hydroxychromene-2-carboxylate isomerase